MNGQSLSLYQAVLADRQQRYNAAIASGKFEPFVYPWNAIPLLILLLSLLFIPRLPRKYSGIISTIASTIIAYLCISTMRRSKTINFAGGYGIGLMCSWGIIMTVTLLLVNDAGRDFQRIEIRQSHNGEWKETNGHGKEANGSVARSTAMPIGTSEPTNRKGWSIDGPVLKKPKEHDFKIAPASYELVWQGHPTSIGHRIDWVFDLMTSFRGPNWNWRLSSLPPIDIPLPENTAGPCSSPTTTPIDTSTSTLHSIQRQELINFLINYLLLDGLKIIMITDPYFVGLAPLSSPTPWSWLSHLNQKTLIATKLVRLGLSITGVLSAVLFIFSASPLFFTVLLPTLLPPRLFRKLVRAPLLEPWMYPPCNASPTNILDSGLPGFWGIFWHQLFRFGMSEPSRYLIQYLDLPPKSIPAKLLQVTTVFTFSGAIHACSSYTTFPPNQTNTPWHPWYPFTGPFLFFTLQGFAVLAQSTFTRLFSTHISDINSWPRPLRRALNGATVLLWLYTTGPLLADDFARCGLWLFEPVPFSVLRGIGFGEGGFWCWGVPSEGRWLGLWEDRGGRWWRNGVAVY
jgi:Membrane bound O-acyl transferase family